MLFVVENWFQGDGIPRAPTIFLQSYKAFFCFGILKSIRFPRAFSPFPLLLIIGMEPEERRKQMRATTEILLKTTPCSLRLCITSNGIAICSDFSLRIEKARGYQRLFAPTLHDPPDLVGGVKGGGPLFLIENLVVDV